MKLFSSILVTENLFASAVPVVQATTDAGNPLLGEIKWVAFTFAPRGWASCDGQLLPIAQNTALFSLLGTTYGGDGKTTFALPDARGRNILHDGAGPGLTNRLLGQRGGTESTALSVSQLPSHSHGLNGTNESADSTYPHSAAVANTGRKGTYSSSSPNTTMDGGTVGASGNGVAHNNMAPSVTLRCIIATQGIFPSRS